MSGDSLTAQEALATLALSGDDDGPRQARSYQVMNGIAVLPVSGTLVSRTRALQPYSGMTGYNGIIARLQQAASDPMVDGWRAADSICTPITELLPVSPCGPIPRRLSPSSRRKIGRASCRERVCQYV